MTESQQRLYTKVSIIAACISFVVAYIYCIVSYGFLLGLGLGWLPSLIFALIMFFLWPLAAAAGVALVVFFIVLMVQ